MFRIDKSSVSYKRTAQPYVLTVPALPIKEKEILPEVAVEAVIVPEAPVVPEAPPVPDQEEMLRQAVSDFEDIVNAHKKEADEKIEKMNAELEQARAELEKTREDIEKAKEDAVSMRKTAQADANDLLEQTRRQTEEWLLEAQGEKSKIKQEADLLLAQARDREIQMLEEAREKADQVRENAQKTGYEAGYEGGKEEGQATYDELLRQGQKMLISTLDRIEQSRLGLADGLEEACLSLSIDIAAKIISTVRNFDENAFRTLVLSAIEKIKHEGKVTVRVSPEEYQMFFNDGGGSLSQDALKVQVLEDSSLKSGDLFLESPFETVNAGIDSQMEVLSRALGQMEESA